jgi:uncharacterized membrane protein YkvA (DUF1232 family)
MAEHWQEPFSQAEIAAIRRATRDEERLAAGFWRVLRKAARHIPFAEDALAAFYCAFDPATSPRVKAILVGAIAYFVVPFDILPDVLPLIGFGDDAAVLAAALAAVQGAVTKAHRDKARQTLAEGL